MILPSSKLRSSPKESVVFIKPPLQKTGWIFWKTQLFLSLPTSNSHTHKEGKLITAWAKKNQHPEKGKEAGWKHRTYRTMATSPVTHSLLAQYFSFLLTVTILHSLEFQQRNCVLKTDTIFWGYFKNYEHFLISCISRGASGLPYSKTVGSKSYGSRKKINSNF